MDLGSGKVLQSTGVDVVYPAAVKNDVRVTTLPTLAPTASSKAYQMIQVDDTESSTWLLVLGGVILVVAVILFCLFMWYLKDKQHRQLEQYKRRKNHRSDVMHGRAKTLTPGSEESPMFYEGMQPELVGPSPSNSVFHINAFGSGFIEDEGVDEDGPADLEDEDPNAKFKLHSVDTGPRPLIKAKTTARYADTSGPRPQAKAVARARLSSVARMVGHTSTTRNELVDAGTIETAAAETSDAATTPAGAALPASIQPRTTSGATRALPVLSVVPGNAAATAAAKGAGSTQRALPKLVGVRPSTPPRARGARRAGAAMPAGWKAAWDPASKRTFYINAATGERTWTRPTATPRVRSTTPPRRAS